MKRPLLIIVLFLSCFGVFAQDIHFSQYFATPMTLNPANTGGFNGDWRIAANYRNQFFSEFTVPYATYSTASASFDMALLQKRLDLDQLGVGLMIYNDRAGSGNLMTTSVMASIAYHKVLDRYNKHSLSIGVQGGFGQKQLDFSKLTFETQFDQTLEGFNPVAPNGEIHNGKTSIIYGNLNAGVLWKSRFGKKVEVYAGFAYANAIRPKQSFIGTSNRMDSRFLVHGGVNIALGQWVTLTPGFMFQAMNTARETNVGIAFGYKINDINFFYIGIYDRINDAIIPMAAYEFHDFRVGLSFDATVSKLKTANSSKGAVEISLVYIHNHKPPRDFSPVKFCPRF